MVGRVGVEPTTSRLSGVRSNHLSYRPIAAPSPTRRAARGVSQLRQHSLAGVFPVMKGHEDGGSVLWNGRKLFLAEDPKIQDQTLNRRYP